MTWSFQSYHTGNSHLFQALGFRASVLTSCNAVVLATCYQDFARTCSVAANVRRAIWVFLEMGTLSYTATVGALQGEPAILGSSRFKQLAGTSGLEDCGKPHAELASLNP